MLKKLLMLIIAVFFVTSLVSASSIERSFSATELTPGDNLDVTLTVTVDGGESYYLIDELYPSISWTITDSDGGDESEAGHLKWIVISGAASTTYTYSLTVPDELGEKTFSGIYAFEGGTEEDIGGGDTITVSNPNNPFAHLKINEFVSDPISGNEWIELHNPTENLVDLTGWTIEDNTGSTASLDGLTIDSHGYLVLEKGTGFTFILNNNGDIIILKEGTEEVDKVAYGNFDDGNQADNAPVATEGKSTGRSADGIDTDVDNVDFIVFDTPTQGATNNGAPPNPDPDPDPATSDDLMINYVRGKIMLDGQGTPASTGYQVEVLTGDNIGYIYTSTVDTNIPASLEGQGYYDTGDDPGFSTGESFKVSIDGYDCDTEEIFENGGNGNFNTGEGLVNINCVTINHPPVFETIEDQEVDEDQLLEFSVNANDLGDDLIYSAENLPEGAGFDPETKTFSWTPDYDDSGIYGVDFVVSDGESEDREEVIITVNNINRLPVLDHIEDQETPEDTVKTFEVSATDPDNDELTYSIINEDTDKVDCRVINEDNIRLTPVENWYGTTTCTVQVSDGESTDSQEFNIEVLPVNDPPVLDPIGDIVVDEGDLIEIFAHATDIDSDILTYSISNPNFIQGEENFPELVAYYNFEGDTRDKSGNNHHGTNYGVEFVNSKPGLGRAASFDGGTDYVEVANHEDLSFTDEVTISMWIKADDVEEGYADHLISKAVPGTTDNANYVWYLFGESSENKTGHSRVYAMGSYGWQVVSSTAFIDLDEWYYLTWTYDKDIGGILYVNGVATGETENPGELATNDETLRIGKSHWLPQSAIDSFDGLIDEVQIWDKAFTEEEVEADYENRNSYFAWQTDYNDAGVYDITVNVADDGIPERTDTEEVRITIREKNEPPYIDLLDDITIDEDSGFQDSIPLSAYDNDGEIDRYVISSEDLDEVDCSVSDAMFGVEPAPDFSGEASCTIRVYDDEDAFDETIVLIHVENINDAPTIVVDPRFDPLISEYGTQVFSITKEDIDNTEAEILVNWYVEGELEGIGDEYEFTSQGAGEYDIKVKVSDQQESVSYEWTVTATDRSILDDTYIGDTTDFSDMTEQELAAVNLILEKQNGKIEFLEPVDLRDIVDLTNYVDILLALAGIDTDYLPPLKDKLSRVTFFNLNYEKTPTIYYDEEFTLNPNEITDVCPRTICSDKNYNSSAGTLSFDVSSFSSFKIGDALSCSAYGGDICTENEVCGGAWIEDALENNCCSTSCVEKPLEFEDAKTCADENLVLNSNIKIDIKDPDEDDKFSIGDTIKVKLKIENNLPEDLDIEDFDVDVSLYNLNDDDEEEDQDDSVDIDEGEDDTLEFEFELPDDLDWDEDYAIFVRVIDEDEDFCNEGYARVDIDMERYDVDFEDIEISETEFVCGDYVDMRIDLENKGKRDADVSLEIENSELDIFEVVDEFEIEKYDDDNTETKRVSFRIPDDAEQGVYVLNVDAFFNDGDVHENVNLNVGRCLSLEAESFDLVTSLNGMEEFSQVDEGFDFGWVILAVALLGGIVFLFVLFYVIFS
ncbi:hypothetical protein CMI37_08050 [Candidatus Pacearchaeota archaeon]|nr:hypothetical protein [Candidatus Pacearchaeota archaeon]|tara:strand:+ start:4819 stop:9465 length:4647 start_codon:yes stop_codon:yes gene_type:complete